MGKQHIVIFRTGGSYIDYTTYNCQEVGLAKALAKKGYGVSVVMGGPEAKHAIISCENNGMVDVFYLTYKSIHSSMCVFCGWKELLDELHPDVVQVHDMGVFMSWVVVKWAKRRGVRCVLVQGSYETTRKPVFKQLEQLFNFTFGKSLLRMVDAIGCKTQAAAEYIRCYAPSGAVAAVTPVGLDDGRFAACCDESTDIRLNYRLAGKKVLLYVGKLEPRRHPLLLLQVMQQLPDDYALLIVGGGSLTGSVKDYIAAHKMTNVVLMGKMKQDRLPAVYRAADLFLLPSSYEIFGMVMLEAMYFGVPVASYSTAGANTVIDSGSGVILPSFDAGVWKESIMEICSDNARLQAMKQRCAAAVREKYVWDKAVTGFEKLYFG